MPGKHVHFAPEIKIYPLPPSPAPSTPHSSYSLPTVSDSDGPFTPLDHWSSPYSYSPLPTTSVSLNSYLAVPSKYGNTAPITLDLTHINGPAKSAAALPPGVLFEPATYPPLPYLVIVHKRLPWHIRLGPSDPSLPFVTVRDVLYGLPAFLRQPASKTEYDLIPTEQGKSNVSNAYLRRSKSAANQEAERVAGLRRVDFLEGRGMFCGLTLTSKGPEVWELHTTT
ncbi:hypothetical protein APHAL10511_001403 [Amanita phalloides]|nr:hypothetical protein APHAL10511_001403 [Amanita phalloides]